MMDFSQEEQYLADQLDDDQRAYHEDQRRMLEQAEHLVDQLRLLGLITRSEAEVLRFFIK